MSKGERWTAKLKKHHYLHHCLAIGMYEQSVKRKCCSLNLAMLFATAETKQGR